MVCCRSSGNIISTLLYVHYLSHVHFFVSKLKRLFFFLFVIAVCSGVDLKTAVLQDIMCYDIDIPLDMGNHALRFKDRFLRLSARTLLVKKSTK